MEANVIGLNKIKWSAEEEWVYLRLGMLSLMSGHIPKKWILDANSVAWRAYFARLKQYLKTS